MYTERDTFGWGPIYTNSSIGPRVVLLSSPIAHYKYISDLLAPRSERCTFRVHAPRRVIARCQNTLSVRSSVRSPPVPRVAICTSRRRKTSALWLTLRISQPHTDGANGLLSTERLARLVHAFASVLLHRSRVNNECFDFHLRSGLRKWTKFAKIKKMSVRSLSVSITEADERKSS